MPHGLLASAPASSHFPHTEVQGGVGIIGILLPLLFDMPAVEDDKENGGSNERDTMHG